MRVVERSDLYYKDYSWKPINNDDPKVTGIPDKTLLNRKEGYEMLYFINKYCELKGYTQKKAGLKVERMIREKVPTDIRSQKNIKNWIDENWYQIKY